MRVLILVLACAREPWLTIEREGQRRTWAASEVGDVSIRFYYGRLGGPGTLMARSALKALRLLGIERAYLAAQARIGSLTSRRSVRLVGDRIHTGVPENYLQTNAKLRACLQHVVASEQFDYLLRTNSSAYVEQIRLKQYVAALPQDGFYGGVIMEKDGMQFVSGRGIILSRDLVEFAAQDPSWEFELVDDVALGRTMRRAGVEPQFVPRLEVACPSDIDRNLLDNHFLVSCRSSVGRSLSRGDKPDEAARDVAIMQNVHRVYGTLR
jgi:hypothetical protein